MSLLALMIGMIAAAVVGYLVGLIALRRTGIYFAMITVAIAEVFFFVEFNPLSDWTGGENGLPGVPTPSFNLGFTTLHFTTGWSLYQFLALCYFVGIVIALRIVRSPVGAILSAIRDNPLRATAVGHNIHGYKLTAFVIAAAYAGFAGGLLGVLQAFMPPDAFTFDTSGQLVMQTAIGGRGTLFGPLVGARSGFSCRISCRRRLGSARPGSWCSASSSCCWSASCGAASSAVSRISTAGSPASRRHAEPAEPAAASGVIAAGDQKAAEAAGHRRAADGGAAARERQRFRSDPAGDRSDQALRRPARQQRYRFHRQPWRIARHHRAERRRQVDVLQDADLRSRADLGQDHVRGAGYHRHERDRCLPARPDQELSGQPAVHGPDGP